jgi:DNA invertase Pin-like site-specific DNA recombinase
MAQAIGYYRVSTWRQGRSGLGLDAQREAVARFAAAEGYDLIGDGFVEVETGKGADALDRRPVLAAALAAARKAKCTIIVAKLCRLSRDVHFVSGLMTHKVPFIVAELGPDVEPFMLHIYAAVYQKEREVIAARTKAALAAKKVRGGVHGQPRSHMVEISKQGVSSRRSKSDRFAIEMAPIIDGIVKSGITDEAHIAEALNRRGVPTARGEGKWYSASVHRVRERAARLK